MKHCIKVYLESEDIKKLKMKAEELGFNSRGGLTRLFEKISREPLVFLDENVRTILRALNLK